MSIGQLTGFATVDVSDLDSFSTCDRCGQLYNHSDLVWDYQWYGFQLINKRLLVCKKKCADIPNQTLRAIVLPPDPIPIQNPRPGFYRQEEAQGEGGVPTEILPSGILFTESGLPIYTESGQPIEIDTGTPIPWVPFPPTPIDAILLEDGTPLLTEDGRYILVDTGIPIPYVPFFPTPSDVVLLENGTPLLTESGQYILLG